MRVEVDSEICERHGQCRIAAPAVFDFDAAGNLQYQPDPAQDLWPDVEDAADMCPVQAILIHDDGQALSGGHGLAGEALRGSGLVAADSRRIIVRSDPSAFGQHLEVRDRLERG